GVTHIESSCCLLACLLGYVVISLLEAQRSPHRVMCIAGRKVNPIPLQHGIRKSLRTTAESTIEGRRRYLNKTTFPHPSGKQLGLALQNRISLRVCDNQRVASEAEVAQDVREM